MFASKLGSISLRPKRSAVRATDHAAAFRLGASALVGACALGSCLAATPANASGFRMQAVAAGGDAIPAAAAAAGYRMETLAVDQLTPSTVDSKLTYASGFQLYYFNFEGMTPDPSTTTFNADGSAVSSTTKTGWNAYGSFMTSAGVIRGGPGFRGTAFGGGGYFEATMSFNAALVNTANGAWPAWWSMALEHMISKGDQWPGQRPGYEHFIEPDFFEYDTGHGASYGGAVHDWYGVNNSGNYYNPNFVRNVPSTTNFSQYHRYGFLWKPATATTKGSLSYYFDGVQVGATYTYTKWTNQPPPPGANTPWTFGVIDSRHLVLIIGTGPPAPMQIKSIQVWQPSGVNNLHN